MIYSLSGTLVYADPISFTAVIECAGVGYKTTVSSNTFTKLPQNTESSPHVRLYTHMQVREDGVELFGFYTKEELSMFKLLISVSGVGPKAAISVLSLMTPEKLAFSVSTEDVKAISKAPNVGAKTAARIILDLKEKLAKVYASSNEDTATGTTLSDKPTSGSKLSDAQDALLVLGYSRQEVSAALRKVNVSASLEEIIRSALAVLMKQ